MYNKRKKNLFLASFATLFAVSIGVLFMNSCKKNSEEQAAKALIGTWYSESQIGVDAILMTTLEFKENGTAHLKMESSDCQGEDDNLDVTSTYEVLKGKVIRYAYDYKEKETSPSGVVFYDEAAFEVKDDILYLYEGNTTDSECFTFCRKK